MVVVVCGDRYIFPRLVGHLSSSYTTIAPIKKNSFSSFAIHRSQAVEVEATDLYLREEGEKKRLVDSKSNFRVPSPNTLGETN